MLQHTMGKYCKEKRLRFHLGDAKELQQNLHERILNHWPPGLEQIEDNIHLNIH
jgi:hypothetical protein